MQERDAILTPNQPSLELAKYPLSVTLTLVALPWRAQIVQMDSSAVWISEEHKLHSLDCLTGQMRKGGKWMIEQQSQSSDLK